MRNNTTHQYSVLHEINWKKVANPEQLHRSQSRGGEIFQGFVESFYTWTLFHAIRLLIESQLQSLWQFQRLARLQMQITRQLPNKPLKHFQPLDDDNYGCWVQLSWQSAKAWPSSQVHCSKPNKRSIEHYFLSSSWICNSNQDTWAQLTEPQMSTCSLFLPMTQNWYLCWSSKIQTYQVAIDLKQTWPIKM